jgi:hypothetical protein
MTQRTPRPTLARASRPLAVLLTLTLMAIAAGCSSEPNASDPWVYGPSLAPGSGAPSEEPAGPSGSVPVGSGAPVASVGPGTSQAPQPSAAP